MKQLILILYLVLSQNILCQTLKTYSGSFEAGMATYQYYENADYERIFHGPFKYTQNKFCTIVGQYKENKRTGNWIYINDFGSTAKTYLKTTGSYAKGIKNGLWTFYNSYLESSQNHVSSVSLNFRNDTIIGKLNLPELTGEFDQHGKFMGKWNCRSGDREFMAEFTDNILIKLIERKISDGKLISKYLPEMDSINLSELKSTNVSRFRKIYYSDDSKSELKSYSEVYGVSEDVKNEQNESLYYFYYTLKRAIASLQNDERKFILLDYFNVQRPQLLAINREYKANHLVLKENDPAIYDISGSGTGNYQLGNRKAINKPKPKYICDEEGMVVVQISVDKNGRVISANPGIRGTTNNAKCLLDQAKIAAMNTNWTADGSAPEKQVGKIIFNFKLTGN